MFECVVGSLARLLTQRNATPFALCYGPACFCARGYITQSNKIMLWLVRTVCTSVCSKGGRSLATPLQCLMLNPPLEGTHKRRYITAARRQHNAVLRHSDHQSHLLTHTHGTRSLAITSARSFYVSVEFYKQQRAPPYIVHILLLLLLNA